MTVHVHIDRVVLDGLDGLDVAPHQLPALRAALVAELTRLAAAAPAAGWLDARVSTAAGTVRLPGGAGTIGRTVARSAFDQIGPAAGWSR
jgi:hypothetical protein